VTFFAAVSGAPAWCIAPNGDVSFIAKILLSELWHATNITYPSSAEKALNESRRLLFLHGFKAKRVNMAAIYTLHALKVKL